MVRLTRDDVRRFALAAGDRNPVHHDEGFAAATRFGRIIASGTHTAALLMGVTASHFSREGAMLGLEFWTRFRRPVFADDTVRIEWLVVDVQASEALGGAVVDLRGRLRRSDGVTAVGARGRVLLVPSL